MSVMQLLEKHDHQCCCFNCVSYIVVTATVCVTLSDLLESSYRSKMVGHFLDCVVSQGRHQAAKKFGRTIYSENFIKNCYRHNT